MRLKRNIDIRKFGYEVQKCLGDVLFCTPEGDRLNLKSAITQIVYSSRFESTGGELICSQQDAEILTEFIEE